VMPSTPKPNVDHFRIRSRITWPLHATQNQLVTENSALLALTHGRCPVSRH